MRIGRFSLTTLILSSLILGLIFGLSLRLFPHSPDGFIQVWLIDGLLQIGGQIFFSALQFLVVPVVFFSLVTGVASLSDIRQMGRIGGKTLAFYMVSTALAISLALILAIIVQPGVGFNLTTDTSFDVSAQPSFAETIIAFIPKNPIQAMAEANMIQIIVLSTLIGIAMIMAGENGKRVHSLFIDINEVVMRIVEIVMMFAPIGVFCLIAQVFAKQGFEAIAPLSKYFFTVMATLFLHVALTYTGLLTLLARLNPLPFFKKMRQVMVFGFSTSSSNATLPVSMEVAEKRLGVKNTVASFTLPLGATINMDGTAIMQGVATVFISQAYSIDIGLSGYIMVILTATLASVGTAGIPSVGLVTLAMVLNQVGLPVEGIGLIIGVDRILDMTRTVVNITGDCAVTCVVAKSEGELDLDIYNDPSDAVNLPKDFIKG